MITMKRLKLNNDIFSLKSIGIAKEAYSELATIAVIQGRRNTELIFTNCKYGEDLTVKEFENYLIGLENSQ